MLETIDRELFISSSHIERNTQDEADDYFWSFIRAITFARYLSTLRDIF